MLACRYDAVRRRQDGVTKRSSSSSVRSTGPQTPEVAPPLRGFRPTFLESSGSAILASQSFASGRPWPTKSSTAIERHPGPQRVRCERKRTERSPNCGPPNKGLERTRRGGVPASRAVIRVSPCRSTQCSTHSARRPIEWGTATMNRLGTPIWCSPNRAVGLPALPSGSALMRPLVVSSAWQCPQARPRVSSRENRIRTEARIK